MQPWLLAEYYAIWLKRDELEWERIAQLASWLMAAWTKDAPSRDKLLGRVVDA